MVLFILFSTICFLGGSVFFVYIVYQTIASILNPLHYQPAINAKLTKIAVKVKEYETDFRKLTNEELRKKTDYFRSLLQKGSSLDDILPEAFAVVSEMGFRVLNERPHFVQVMGAVALHKGMIAEMKTGEGKTIVATMPAYLNSLTGKGVHIVTVNDYLAKRDSEWMGKIFENLGLTVGCVLGEHEMNLDERRYGYSCDITYISNSTVGFDYLRDNGALDKSELVQRGFNYAILDEIDQILLDDGITPLIISGAADDSSELYKWANDIVSNLTIDDYIINLKEDVIVLSEQGWEKISERARMQNLLKENESFFDDNRYLLYLFHIKQALRANYFLQKDIDYTIIKDHVVLIGELSGRLLKGRRMSEGIHQALEAKEGILVRAESQTIATITFQRLFQMYDKLSGMTGTAATAKDEFQQVYKLDIAVLPTNKPVIRIDHDDIFFDTIEHKVKAIVAKVLHCKNKGALELKDICDLLKVEVVTVDASTSNAVKQLKTQLHSLVEQCKTEMLTSADDKTIKRVGYLIIDAVQNQEIVSEELIKEVVKLYIRIQNRDVTIDQHKKLWMIMLQCYNNIHFIPEQLRKFCSPNINKCIRLLKDFMINHQHDGKFYDTVKALVYKHESSGQPMLIGAASVKSAEYISASFHRYGLYNFNILSAKTHEDESQIVADAGRSGMITVVTNMAGRGTNIRLGGCVSSQIQSLNKNDTNYDQKVREIELSVAKNKERVMELGGLFVVGTERNKHRRGDLQLLGRSGRQGEPGESIFYISLEDELLQTSTNISTLRVSATGYEYPTVLSSYIQNTLSSQDFERRQNTYKYSQIQEQHREAIYELRNEVLFSDVEHLMTLNKDFCIAALTLAIKYKHTLLKNNNVDLIDSSKNLEGLGLIASDALRTKDRVKYCQHITNLLCNFINKSDYELRSLMLLVIDEEWKQYLSEIDILRKNLHMYQYSNQDLFSLFKTMASELFNITLQNILTNYTRILIHRIKYGKLCDNDEEIAQYTELFGNISN